MKQIFLYFFVLVSLTLSAQRQLPFYNTAAGTLTQTGAGSGYVDVRINYSDQTGITTGSTVDNTCVLLYFNTDESLGYELPILSVTTPSATNPVVRVNITGFPALNGAINGQGVIYKKSSSKHFAPFVSNASNSLQQVIQEAMARDIETALNSATDVTKYVGSGAPAFTPATNEPKLAQGLSSPYPLYKWNGSAWILDGSGVGSVADTTRTAYQYATMKWTDSTALHADGNVFKDTLISGRNILLNNYPTMDASGTITNGDLFSKYDAETGVYQKVRGDSLKSFIGESLLNPTNGYLPYKSGNVFGNSPIYTNGMDIGLAGDIDSVKRITTISVIAPSSYLTATDAGVSGNLNGTYYYCYKYYTADGETEPTSPAGSAAITVTNKKVNLSGITVSSNPKVIGRKLYRTRASADDAAEMQFLATIADNTTTTYSDNISDVSLGAVTTFTNTTGGVIYDNNAMVFSEGSSALSIGKGNGILGYSNTAIGPSSMTGSGYGYRNTAVGLYSQYLLRNGARNVSIGTHSLNDNLDGDDNTGLGYGALHFNLASHNTAVGREAASANVNGVDNTAVGYFAGERNINGNLNTSVGKYALLENLGNNNTAVGAISLQNVANGTSNVGLGYQSGTYTSTGGNLTSSTASLFVGFDTRPLGNNSVYETVIGTAARGHGDFTTTIGAASILKTIIYGNIGLGTSNPLYKLDIDANTGSTGNPIRLQGLQVGSASDSIVSSNAGVLKRTTINDMLGTTTSSLRVPRLTTTQRDALNGAAGSVTGDVIYNSTTDTYQVGSVSSAWLDVNTTSTIKVSNDPIAIPSITGMTTGFADQTVTGAAVGNTVIVNPRSNITTDNVILGGAYVVSTNTVRIIFFGTSVGTNGAVTRNFDIQINKN